VHIRPIEPSDAAALVPLCGQLGYPATLQQAERRLQLLLGHPGQGLLGAETAAGQLVGWVHVQSRCVFESDPFAEICGLVVDEHARGHGVGAGLVAAAEQWAVAEGHTVIRVRSNVIRTDTHRFYQNRGFAIQKSQISFTKRLRSGTPPTPGSPA
jgi:GNAT superfamily N-acetyltransferase